MPRLQPNITYAGANTPLFVPMGAGNIIPGNVTFAGTVTMEDGLNIASGDMAIQTGSLTLLAGGIGVQGEIIGHGGMTFDGGDMTAVGVNISTTDGGQVNAVDGNCRTRLGAITQELAYIDMTGNTDDGPVMRLAVGGGSPVAPYETYKFGIYANQGGDSPFVEALSVDSSAVVKIAGKPVCSPEKVAFVGVSGTAITLAVGAQTISADFTVKANHTYRVTVQGHIVSGDTTPGAFVELAVIDGSGVIVGLGRQIGGPNNDNGEKAYSGIFVAPADSAVYKVQSVNATVASASFELNATSASINPTVLVEDLGVL